ncbi:MAG: AAA family ATPase [Leadbetterella sp.]|jgi:predicted ATPase|nr:AAA family ATPase [Leadbetterella sp.]
MKLKSLFIKNFKGLRDIQVENFSEINAFVGKNNSGKSSILHAIDIASLAISVQNWNAFQPKLKIKDMINDAGNFEIMFLYDDETETVVKSSAGYEPLVANRQENSPKSILILPDVGFGMLTRHHRTPQWVIEQLEAKNFQNVNALEILYAIKFYSYRNERGLTPKSYESILAEVSNYFPDILNLNSDRTEDDIATLTYEEYGQRLDILYSGTGLKHFLDILIKITLSGAKIVLLDEPELGLHPDLQRRFIDYLHLLSTTKNIQIFIGSHSQVILNYAESIKFYRVLNNAGDRKILSVDKEAVHTVLSDLGIRPSDLFNQDICFLVEGASEVVFFEHVIRTLYKDEFEKVAVGIIQYGGDAAAGIVSGSISISNIVSSQKYLFWLRDRDAKPQEKPALSSTKFKNKIVQDGYDCVILNKREIEYYYTLAVHVAAQQGDPQKELNTTAIYEGDQGRKYRSAAEESNICVPSGKNLRKLLVTHLTDKFQLDQEIRTIIEQKLIPWKKEILGEV